MKKIFILLISFLLIFSLVSCEFPSITPFNKDTENNTENNTDNNTKENTDIKSDTTIKFKENEFSKYFSTKEGQTLTLSQGKDKIDALYVTQYIGKDKIQILEVNGSRFQTVYEFTEDGVFLTYNTEMSNKDAPVNLTLTATNTSDKKLFLKSPLKVGTKWIDDDNNSHEITAIDKSCVTKAGEFKTIEITIVNPKSKTITKNYFGENLGLIKSVTRNEKDEIINLKQLISVN